MINAIPDSPRFIIDYELQRIGIINFNESIGFVRVLPEVRRKLLVSTVENNELLDLISEEIEIGVDHFLTVIVSGTMDSPQFLMIDETVPEDFVETEAPKLRVVHASPSAPATVDFHLDADDEPLSGPLLRIDTNTVSESLILEASVSLRARLTDPADDLPFWDSGIFSVSEFTRSIFILTDYFGPGDEIARMISYGATIFPDEDLISAVSFANMISDQSTVDFYIGDTLVEGTLVADTLIAEDINFGDIQNYIQLPPGEYAVKVTTANDADDIIAEAGFFAAIGEYHTIFTTGLATTNTLAISSDDLRRISSRAAVTFTHAAAIVGAVDMYFLLPGQTVENVRPFFSEVENNSSRNIRLQEGTYNVVFTFTRTRDIALDAGLMSISGNELHRIYLIDSIGGNEPLQTILAYDLDPNFSP
ncbi:MAG: DUF4397 domain-containing protein [Pseudomonadales bacterium]